MSETERSLLWIGFWLVLLVVDVLLIIALVRTTEW